MAYFEESYGFSVGADIGPDPSILLQSFVTPDGKTNEGRIVRAAFVPWLDIVALIKTSKNVIFQIPPDKWEEIIAAAYERAGFDEVILTPRSGDYGRDVIAIKKGLGVGISA